MLNIFHVVFRHFFGEKHLPAASGKKGVPGNSSKIAKTASNKERKNEYILKVLNCSGKLREVTKSVAYLHLSCECECIAVNAVHFTLYHYIYTFVINC